MKNKAGSSNTIDNIIRTKLGAICSVITIKAILLTENVF